MDDDGSDDASAGRDRLARPAATSPRASTCGSGPGDYRYRGADLGILVTRTRLESPDGRLTDRCRAWIDGIRSRFVGAPLEPEAPPPIHDALAFKTG